MVLAATYAAPESCKILQAKADQDTLKGIADILQISQEHRLRLSHQLVYR